MFNSPSERSLIDLASQYDSFITQYMMLHSCSTDVYFAFQKTYEIPYAEAKDWKNVYKVQRIFIAYLNKNCH